MFQDQSGSKIHKTTQVAPLFTTIVNMNWHTSDLAKPIINFSNELSHVLTSEIVTLTLLISRPQQGFCVPNSIIRPIMTRLLTCVKSYALKEDY